MTRRLQRRTAEAPHWGDEQHRYNNYRLTDLHQAADTYQVATGSLLVLWTIQVAHG